MSDFEPKKRVMPEFFTGRAKAAPARFFGLSAKDQTIAKLRALTAHLHRVREEERGALAREVHDGIAQSLTSLKLDLARLRDTLSGEEETIRGRVESTSREVDQIIQAVRRIASVLTPPLLDDFGLRAAIEWQLEELEKKTGIRFDFSSDLADCGIDRDRSIEIFRILEEALANVARHSKAKTARICLRRYKERLILKVSDTGVGIRKSDITGPRSLGLLEMRERAMSLGGTLRVAKARSGGTDVTAAIPLGRPGAGEKKQAVANPNGTWQPRVGSRSND